MMNLYVHTINNVIEYIEQNISKPLTLQGISREFFLSEFHFGRLFKTLTGTSLKQYIIGRKFAVAVERLKNTDASIGNIALELGFEYPEAFSRAFKKQFGISPSFCRKGMGTFDIVPKARVVERDIVNFGGVITLKEDYIYLDSFNLYGQYFEVDENDANFSDTLKNAGSSVLQGFTDNVGFYSVVNCHGDESGKYTVFFGKRKPPGTIFQQEIFRRGGTPVSIITVICSICELHLTMIFIGGCLLRKSSHAPTE